MRIFLKAILDSDDYGADPNVMIVIGIGVTLVFLAMYRSYRRQRTTKFRGPSSNDFIFGVTKEIFNSPNPDVIYRNWEKTYGPVYQIPSTLGSTIIVLQDPAAVAHLCAKDTSTYHQTNFFKALWGNLVSFSRTCKVILIRLLDR